MNSKSPLALWLILLLLMLTDGGVARPGDSTDGGPSTTAPRPLARFIAAAYDSMAGGGGEHPPGGRWPTAPVINRLLNSSMSGPIMSKLIDVSLNASIGALIMYQQQLLGGKCLAKASCRLQISRQLEKEPRSCHCDANCAIYDDCCHDAPLAQSLEYRRSWKGLTEVADRRSQWTCIKVPFGEVPMRASCPRSWLEGSTDRQLAETIKRRCEWVGQQAGRLPAAATWKPIAPKVDQEHQYEADPMGMMMHITDLANGITYANSYCLRCNRLPRARNSSAVDGGQPKPKSGPQTNSQRLVYWSPSVECNYNIETDNRNALYDLVSKNKGRVLRYSSQTRAWHIDLSRAGHLLDELHTAANDSSTLAKQHDRKCTIRPSFPDSLAHLVRRCTSNLITSCPFEIPAHALGNVTDEGQALRSECRFGHRALTYSKKSLDVYQNLACAKCNGELTPTCDPTTPETLVPDQELPESRVRPESNPPNIGSRGRGHSYGHSRGHSYGHSRGHSYGHSHSYGYGYNRAHADGNRNTTPPIDDQSTPSPLDSIQPKSPAFLATFAITFDFSSADNGQVGQEHRCPDPERQIYDVFHDACRDLVCGFDKRENDEGQCVDAPSSATTNQGTPIRATLVQKFSAPMAYLSAVGLLVSIISLALYLLLYCLSMVDLRKLARQVEAAKSVEGSDWHRASRCSVSQGSTSGRPAAGQSLSSRGVACLSASLLAAYLLFVVGGLQGDANHEPSEARPADNTTTHQHGHQSAAISSCMLIAMATYFCFMVSFSWMFLLSYDIWRTLRLATCLLQGPASHSQSKRFLSYVVASLLFSGSLVAGAAYLDLAGARCLDGQTPHNSSSFSFQGSLAGIEVTSSMNFRSQEEVNAHASHVNCTKLEMDFINYRPGFGQTQGTCWFSSRHSLALFFALPVSLVMLMNLVFFLHSSCMVISTSIRSSATPTATHQGTFQFGVKAKSCSRGSNDSALSSASSSSSSNAAEDFAHQNNLTTSSLASVGTIQSQLSASVASSGSGSSSDESGTEEQSISPPEPRRQPPPAGANEQGTRPRPPPPANRYQRKQLEQTLSQSSIMTNKSTNSLSSSLASKCDASLNTMSSLMGSLAKDYKLYCRLSTIMGLTWMTGIAASIVDASEVLWYVFVVLNTLQGLFIFIAFGCKQSKLRNLKILFAYLQLRASESLGGCLCTYFRSSKEHSGRCKAAATSGPHLDFSQPAGSERLSA